MCFNSSSLLLPPLPSSSQAGIPDFRSPGSGLYDTMAAKFNLSQPQSLFEIDFYLANPEPFLYLAKELLNARIKPTASHYFQVLDAMGCETVYEFYVFSFFRHT